MKERKTKNNITTNESSEHHLSLAVLTFSLLGFFDQKTIIFRQS